MTCPCGKRGECYVETCVAPIEDIEILHIMTKDGCKISVNGQGHFPCDEHKPPVCALCGNALIYKNGWPWANAVGCIDSYHDGGFGSSVSPGYCGVKKSHWFRTQEKLSEDKTLTWLRSQLMLDSHDEDALEEVYGDHESAGYVIQTLINRWIADHA